MTRILHILDHSLPAHSGYTFRTRALMKAQAAKGWSVAGVTSVRHPLEGPSVEEVDGLSFYRTPAIALQQSPFGEMAEIKALAVQIEQVAEKFKPDLLHAHSPVLTALAALRANKKLGLPLLYEIRAFWEDAAVGNGTGHEGSLKYRATRALESYAVRKADAVAVICEGLRSDLITRGVTPDKITVSPNGVDLDLFGTPLPFDTDLADELGLRDADVLGFIGSFYDYEGLDDLIAAMPLIVARQPRAKLVLVGGGPMENALREQVESSMVADHILFTGRVPHDQVERYYSLIDILVYPRKKMRLTDLVTPLKPLEAMAQQRLVAASDVGGHRELIEDGVTGTLFPANNPQGLADAICKMLAERAGWAERKAVARAYVERDRNWSANILRYEPVYQMLLKSKK